MLIANPRQAPAVLDGVRRLHMFFTTIVVIQGIHVVEHIIQLVQVYLFRVSDDDAMGLLGYVFSFQGTEEWLHLAFNVSFLAALYIVFVALWRTRQLQLLPRASVAFFVLFGLGLETWHVIEHAVIINNVIANDGCPCPGIGDQALGISDTVLHFGYNAVAYAATVVLFAAAVRLPAWSTQRRSPRRRASAGPGS